jgi:hypothetical protein
LDCALAWRSDRLATLSPPKCPSFPAILAISVGGATLLAVRQNLAGFVIENAAVGAARRRALREQLTGNGMQSRNGFDAPASLNG